MDSQAKADRKPERPSGFVRFLYGVERVGNKLPHPFWIFWILIGILLVISNLVASTGVSVIHPGTGAEVKAVALLSANGLRMMVEQFVSNFQKFGPLGIVLVMVAGVGVAEGSGLITAVMKKSVMAASDKYLVPTLLLVSVSANIASDAAIVVIPPIAAMIFQAKGKNPMIGLLMTYGAMCAGWSANLLISTVDVATASLSEAAAHLIDPTIVVPATVNWYFNLASALLLPLVGTIVTYKIVAPMLDKQQYKLSNDEKASTAAGLTSVEKEGLKKAGIAVLIYLAVVALLVVPASGILRDPATGSIVPSPFLKGLVFVLFMFFLIPGIVYGRSTGSIKNSTDIVKLMTNAEKDMAGYVVLIIAASQFTQYFNWSNLAVIMSVKSADYLKTVGFSGLGLGIGLALVTVVINIFIGSASAKWAMFAPVFVPMFMLLGFSPGFAQMSYRIGDSVTNAISPLFPYFPILLGYAKRYTGEEGMGTIIAPLLPYTIFYFLSWIVLLVVWYYLRLPMGPAASMFL